MQEWVRREEIRGLPRLSEGVHGVDAEGRHLQQVPVRGGHGDAWQKPPGVQSSWTEKPASSYLQVNLKHSTVHPPPNWRGLELIFSPLPPLIFHAECWPGRSFLWSCIIQSLLSRAASVPAWQLRFEAKTEEIDCNGVQHFFVISTGDLRMIISFLPGTML